jgi:phosphatidylethanolamine/phosphatidyl-N-methylethanolamine N-methyltransferase
MSSSSSFYNIIAPIYPLIDLFLVKNRRKLLELVNECSIQTILDIGIADGSYLKYYKVAKVFGIDSSSNMIELAAKRSALPKYDLRVMSAESLSFEDEFFDSIVLSHVLSVVLDLDKVMNEVVRVTKKNGKVYVLNHFTPINCIRWFDKSFSFIGHLFQFDTVFYQKKLLSYPHLILHEEINLFPCGYFKILVFKRL